MHFNTQTTSGRITLLALVLMGTVATGSIIRQLYYSGPTARTMTREERSEFDRRVMEKERSEWEKMWRESGKKPPPIPAPAADQPH